MKRVFEDTFQFYLHLGHDKIILWMLLSTFLKDI